MRKALLLLLSALLLGAALVLGLRLLGRLGPPGEPGTEPATPQRPLAADRPPAVVPEESGATGAVYPAIAGDCIDRNNRATVLLEEGRLREAVERFRQCVEEEPGEEVYARNLCEALVRLARREVDEARRLDLGIEALEEALALEVGRADREALEDLLARWREEWAVGQNDLVEPSLYFELAYDPDRRDLLYGAHQVMDLLDRAYVELTQWFPADPVRRTGRKLRITFYDSEEFDRVTGLGDWAGGVFDGTIRLAVDALEQQTERWSRVARHELVHAFVEELGGDAVPGWLNEGLAQWLDFSIFPNSRRRDQLANAHERLRGTELFPIESLRGSLASWTDQDAIARAYAQSLAMVAFIEGLYGRDALLAMVVGAGEPGGVEAAFRKRTGVELATVPVDLTLQLQR